MLTAARVVSLRRFFLPALFVMIFAPSCREEGAFPSREVRIVVHAAPGGISDTVARFVARLAQDELGVPIICENRTGAAGSVALSYVSRSRPDGYTIGYAPVDLAIIHHLGYSELTPDQFDFLAMHTRAPASIAVRSDSPWRRLEDLIEAARVKAGQISMGNSGTGSIWHLAGLALARQAKVEFATVPFPGSGPAITALLGGHVDVIVAGPPEVQSHVEAGSLRLLGVMAAERSPVFPEVPTLREKGYDLEFSAWGGFLAPKEVPSERIVRLQEALYKVLRGDEFRRFCSERGLEISILEGEEFARFARTEFESFRLLVLEASQ